MKSRTLFSVFLLLSLVAAPAAFASGRKSATAGARHHHHHHHKPANATSVPGARKSGKG
jgi:hypothetical protein